jgi:transcriptional regulator with XRE-family HTH domain
MQVMVIDTFELYAATDATVIKQLGERIKRVRQSKNFTMQEVADKMGATIATIYAVENGKGCTLATLVKVFRALGRLEELGMLMNVPAENPLELLTLQKKRIVRQRVRKLTVKTTKQ